jgi:hypothetical protein
MILLAAVGDVHDLVGLEVLGAVEERGEVGRSVVRGTVLLAATMKGIFVSASREKRGCSSSCQTTRAPSLSSASLCFASSA